MSPGVLVRLQRAFDLSDLVGGQTEFFFRSLEKTAAELRRRRRGIRGLSVKGEQPAGENRGGQGEC